MTRVQLCRVLFLACAVLVILTALSVATIVIPAVRFYIFPGATPERAVPAFWVATASLAVTAIVFLVLAVRARARRLGVTVTAALTSLVLLFLTLAFADARAAYLAWGPGFHFPALVLLLCAAASLSAVVMGLSAALLLPKRV